MKELELVGLIKRKKINTLDMLTTELGVSEATTRRRLNELQAAGFIKLRRGGKFDVINELELSTPDLLKQKQVGMNKQLSSKIAAAQICDGDIIFIDNGTTVREMLKHIKAKDIKIYTNGVFHTLNNQNLPFDLNIIPGELLVKEASIVGAEAISYLSTLVIDKAFIGANGYDDVGIYTPHRREMVVKEFALRHARRGYIVMTEDKFGVKSKYQICERNQYHLITESTI
ncbi:DeoR/GlpR family DNA-binding transcription regulator [Mollicutes bacterium LVI A0039]|nr:DeoR/GlpR family DNA-binding transcription regulator [Mollicutes bacterium LVI A0039]